MVQETSKITYREINQEGLISDGQRKVYEALLHSLNGLTDSEIMTFLGYADPNIVRPRRKELFDYGLVIEKEKRPCSITGRSCIVWVVSNETTRDKFVREKVVCCPLCKGTGKVNQSETGF